MRSEERKFKHLSSRPPVQPEPLARAIRHELAQRGRLPWQVLGEHRATGASSHSIVVYQAPPPLVERVIEKQLTARPGALAELWLDEALFSERLRDRLELKRIRIPRRVSIEVIDRREVRLYLEHVDGYRPMRGLDERLGASRAFSELAVRSREKRLHEQAWLHRSVGVGHAAPQRAFHDLLSLIGMGKRKARMIEATIQDFYDHRSKLNAQYQECVPTLTHGDANYLNVLASDASDEFLVVDWARVGSGMVGDDLARLVLPWIVTHGGAREPEELLALEAEFVDAYSAGFSSAASAQILFSYQLKSVTLAIGIARTLMNWRAGVQASGDRKDVDAALHSLATVVADRAARLADVRALTASGRQFSMTSDQDRLTKRYTGTVASTYNRSRSGSERWRKEHAEVRSMLQEYSGATVLDLPVGTGRFVSLYQELRCNYIGVDISDDMLREASAEAARVGHQPDKLVASDAVTMDPADFAADVAVAVRFFNWLSAEAAAKAFANIAASSRQALILSLTTIDLSVLPAERRPRVAASLDRAHHTPQPTGQPPNGPHRWDHFQGWVLASGMELVTSSLVFETQNNLVNHIHLLRR